MIIINKFIDILRLNRIYTKNEWNFFSKSKLKLIDNYNPNRRISTGKTLIYINQNFKMVFFPKTEDIVYYYSPFSAFLSYYFLNLKSDINFNSVSLQGAIILSLCITFYKQNYLYNTENVYELNIDKNFKNIDIVNFNKKKYNFKFEDLILCEYESIYKENFHDTVEELFIFNKSKEINKIIPFDKILWIFKKDDKYNLFKVDINDNKKNYYSDYLIKLAEGKTIIFK